MNESILYGKADKNGHVSPLNEVVDSSVLLKLYRKHADMLTGDLVDKTEPEWYNNEAVCRYVYSVCQYYVVVNGKDKKFDKMRALFDMSMSLMACFFLLAGIAILAIPFGIEMSIKICEILKFGLHGCFTCTDKVLVAAICVIIAIIFYYRAKRNMRHFLLILLGTYDAIVRSEENNDVNKYNIMVKIKEETD